METIYYIKVELVDGYSTFSFDDEANLMNFIMDITGDRRFEVPTFLLWYEDFSDILIEW